MNITTVFFIGFFIALIGVIPPGMLNITAAKVSLREGAARGIVFSIGVCITVFVQTVIASIFSKYLSNHPEVIDILQRVAFIIFVLISIYFLVLASKQKNESIRIDSHTKSKKSRLFHGLLLSALNVFPIPYQAYMTTTIAAFGWLKFQNITILSYATGAAMGTFVMLYIYIFFFHKLKNKAFTSQRNMNFIIGCITGIVALSTLFNILNEL